MSYTNKYLIRHTYLLNIYAYSHSYYEFIIIIYYCVNNIIIMYKIRVTYYCLRVPYSLVTFTVFARVMDDNNYFIAQRFRDYCPVKYVFQDSRLFRRLYPNARINIAKCIWFVLNLSGDIEIYNI